jgi:hypothetical protein
VLLKAHNPSAAFSKYPCECELVTIAVVVRTAATGLRSAVRKRLPGLLADCDSVLQPCILLCGLLLQRLDWLDGFFRLRLRVDCLNRVN